MNTHCVTELHFVQGCHGVQRLPSKLVAQRMSGKFKRSYNSVAWRMSVKFKRTYSSVAWRMSAKFKRSREIGQTSPIMEGEQHIMLTLLRVIPTLLHFFRHSIWHIFWHSIWHLFWHSFWHSFWHCVWRSLWHVFGSRCGPLHPELGEDRQTGVIAPLLKSRDPHISGGEINPDLHFVKLCLACFFTVNAMWGPQLEVGLRPHLAIGVSTIRYQKYP